MDQRILFALIGALPGLVPAILLYMQRKRELSTSEPVAILRATSEAEAALRSDLIKSRELLLQQVQELREENKELKEEVRELKKRIEELEKLSKDVREAWTSHDDKNIKENNKTRKNWKESQEKNKKD